MRYFVTKYKESKQQTEQQLSIFNQRIDSLQQQLQQRNAAQRGLKKIIDLANQLTDDMNMNNIVVNANTNDTPIKPFPASSYRSPHQTISAQQLIVPQSPCKPILHTKNTAQRKLFTSPAIHKSDIELSYITGRPTVPVANQPLTTVAKTNTVIFDTTPNTQLHSNKSITQSRMNTNKKFKSLANNQPNATLGQSIHQATTVDPTQYPRNKQLSKQSNVRPSLQQQNIILNKSRANDMIWSEDDLIALTSLYPDTTNKTIQSSYKHNEPPVRDTDVIPAYTIHNTTSPIVPRYDPTIDMNIIRSASNNGLQLHQTPPTSVHSGPDITAEYSALSVTSPTQAAGITSYHSTIDINTIELFYSLYLDIMRSTQ